ncbi:eva-1 homolog Bb [Hypomesus transpacificus]|uniref:eva-1 homolog Bb n=1 Tax=Hypomesus transpacificus TaxID=137520 RepID=UPI001F077DCE|nr:eva-1 homolog Bb [Hypomesus transpacificus]XP_046875273.1 eva-1 homolog Bb [Hypomesus transpacificus]
MEPIRKDMELLSNSMATFAHIKANPETLALYFMMGVCSGLLLALCLLVVSIACKTCQRARTLPPAHRSQLKERGEDESLEGDSSEEEDVSSVLVSPLTEHSHIGTVRSVNVFASAEELEKARRLEERERIIRDIWRNGQPDILVTGTGTVGRVHYH